MKYLGIGLIFLTVFYSGAMNIAITIDDHPMPSGEIFNNAERTRCLADACKRHNVKAAFFCIGKDSAENDPDLLASLNSEGHFLANHSFTHRHLSEYSLEEFESEIEKTEAVLKPYSNMRKWFRYPFLDYGERKPSGGSNEKKRAAYNLLKELGYKEGYVSINTFDWHVDARLQEAKKAGKRIDYDRLRDTYVSLVKEWCNHYTHEYSENPVTHTLLLHANDLNGLYLNDLLNMINESGWNIVSPEEAFEDVEWREEVVLGESPFRFEKPDSLDCDYIDRVIEEANIYSSQ